MSRVCAPLSGHPRWRRDRLARAASRRSFKRSALLGRCWVSGVPRSCPPQPEPGDIPQYVIAIWHVDFLSPCDQIGKRRLTLGAAKSAMSDRPRGALNQEMRCPGLVGAFSVILLEPKGHTEVRGLVDRHDRNPNLPGQLRENRVRLHVTLRFNAGNVPVQCHFIDAETRIDFIMDLPRIGIACELLRFTRSRDRAG